MDTKLGYLMHANQHCRANRLSLVTDLADDGRRYFQRSR